MGGLDISAIGLLIGMVGAVLSFWVGRKLRIKRQAKRREKDRAKMIASETRQQRRARERREQNKR
ncbi:MAG: hypothetical protein EOO29_15470 [Comamonadaceae bacterium]|nr:MAG: hypothetical protein EOO29_15470 [Comamonadaceae bacterium]